MQLPISFIANELAFDGPSAAVEFLNQNNAGYFVAPKKNAAADNQATAPQRRGSLLERMDVDAPDDDKVLDCRPAHAPLTEILASKYSRVGIKGRI